MTPIERAQSAIAQILGVSPFPIESFMVADGRMISSADLARSVIAAIREPSEEMLVAGAFCQPILTPEGQKPFTPGKIIAWSCYEAMLDAITSEPTQEKLTQKLAQKAE